MTQTYDPILEVEQLRRLRIGSPLRGPSIGTVLVLERAVGAPVVVWPGERVPDARTGNYRRLHRVDVANRGLAFTATLPSADPAFPFIVTVRFSCRITDPLPIVQDNVRDMTAALMPSLAAIAREAVAGFDAMHPSGAEAEIARRLNSAHSSAAVELTGFSADVTMVDAEEIVTARRKIRVEEMRRAAMRPVAAGSREEMLAHVMALTDGNPMALLDREGEKAEAETRAKLDALRILMGAGDKMEEFNASEIRREALGEFFGNKDVIPLRSSVRDRIARKPLDWVSRRPFDAWLDDRLTDFHIGLRQVLDIEGGLTAILATEGGTLVPASDELPPGSAESGV
jgi:hypothetical protein